MFALGVSLPLGGAAWADGYTTKVGMVGILDIPTAETLGLGGGRLGLDLYGERTPEEVWRVAPLPLALVAGLPFNLDLGLAVRDSGLPGDPAPALPLLTATVKFGFLRARGWRPGLAVAATFDRLNWKVESSVRLVASTAQLGPVRVAAFAGGALTEADLASVGPIGGLAVLIRGPREVEFAAEGLRASTGWMVGAGVRWAPLKHLGFSAAVTWKPGDLAPRIALGVALFAGEPALELPPDEAAAALATPEGQVTPSGPRAYPDPRPRFRLKIHPSTRGDSLPRHLQYAPEPEGGAATPTSPSTPATPATPAAPADGEESTPPMGPAP